MDFLRRCGFRKFGELKLFENSLSVTFTDPLIAGTEKGVYAWILGGEIVRIGASQAPLQQRAKLHGRWIEARLQGAARISNARKLESQTDEARRWKEALAKHDGYAEVWGRQGTIVQTPMGPLNVYLAEENFLLQRYKPIFNNSYFR